MIMKKSVHGYRLIIGYLGLFLVLIGIVNLIPLINLIFYPEDYIYTLNFLIPGILSIVIGLLLSLTIRNRFLHKFKNHEDMVFVVLVWMSAIFVTAIPFYIEGVSITHAIFEATSGLTTTGASILTATGLPKIFQLHQAVLLFLGGVGLVLVMTSAISDRHGLRLYQAEGHQDKLMSNLAKSAKLILTMYSAFIMFGTVMFTIFGMEVFDALFYSISAVSTGGFAPHVDSIGHYNHLGIELTAILLMLLGATNFLTHVYLFSGKFKKVFHHGITYLFLGVLVLFTLLIALNNYQDKVILNVYQSDDFLYYIRHALFLVVSAITTTGLVTVSGFTMIPAFSMLLLFILMLIGGQAGSTAGAMKQDRIIIALQSSYWFIRDKMSNKRTIRTNFTLKYNKYETISDIEVSHNYAFIIIYLMILMFASLLIMSQGFGFDDTLFDVASAMSNAGFSSGIMSKSSNNFVLWVLTFVMFLGRLEFTILFIVIIKVIKDILKRETYIKEDGI